MQKLITTAAPGFLAAALLSSPAQGVFPAPDQEVLEHHIAEVQVLAEEALSAAVDFPSAYEALRVVLQTQYDSLAELESRLSLTGFDGIETQDQYQEAVVMAVGRIAAAAVAADTTLPPPEHARTFAAQLSELPSLGDTPLPFMVITLSSVTLATADSILARDLLPEPSVHELTVRLLDSAARAYTQKFEDIFATNRFEHARATSVLNRLRCPADEGDYRLATTKASVQDDGTVSRIYFLKCNKGGEDLEVSFRVPLSTRVNEVHSRQQQVPSREGSRGGLDP
jgi:hypothetical protein